MPRTKSINSSAVKSSRGTRKPAVKTLRLKRKTKSVLVDVIEDEALSAEPSWLEPQTDKETSARKDPISDISRSADEAEIDSQKKFFSDLAAKIKTKDKHVGKDSPTGKDRTAKRSVGLYRRLVIKFVVLVALLAGVVLYFSFSKLTVIVSLKGEPISDNLLLKVTDGSAPATTTALNASQNDPREAIVGTIKPINSSVNKTYPATGETYLGEEIIGRVRIINNYNKNQSLVATTRLLSPDGKLFRIKNAVNVPAGGEVLADIYVEKPTEDLAIGPTNFTIPGLWLGLQDKIYAKSDEKFVFSKKVKKYVNASDLASAAKDISEVLATAAKNEANAGLTGNNWFYSSETPATVKIEAKVGDQKDEFSVSASEKIVAVAFSREQAGQLAAAKLNLIVPDNKELTEFQPENIIYSLENYDPVSNAATVKASFTGTMVLKSDSQIIDPQQLVNLTASQLDTYLKDQPEIKEYELKFSPVFIKKAPSLVDRIKIEVNKN